MAYPAVLGELGEFVDTLNWLQITHEERCLLEEIMHPERSMNTSSHATTSTIQQNPRLETVPAHTSHFSCDETPDRRRGNHTRTRGIEAHGGQGRLPIKHRRRNLASKRAKAAGTIDPKNIYESAEGGHDAFVVPWQSSDLPLTGSKGGFEKSTHDDAGEGDMQNGSSSVSDYSVSGESCTEQVDCSHDYIKIPWCEDGD
ncbi:uncharacterized protein RCC_12231 [Ramularia collo-cygni]|uniref:Uncharacterized protein n=1 Tax=Ramularia collo-cygni TaxID=112498 RepID=A0A2D3V344_9PEZI|nr:uncharacterized protein RCC_12231 [Ramularia collo-cygni]CZT14693.1 uncharacterized protein RCC_12231 [Ramularia collo-cygni]